MAFDERHPDQALAPPVVAVLVVHAPGVWFDETLESLARQDYPNLNTLFLLAGGTDDADGRPVGDRIRAVLPEAFVRVLEGGPSTGPGFGTAANAVFDVVDGGSGFLLICHDDIALAPDSIRVLVEEIYRTNAGIVGPKLVDWDNPSVLQDIGLDVDRFGVAASRIDQGEYDQEQHDVPAEVFAVPSACMLVRADLFRALGGFDHTMRYVGEDVDLCWRARITGARVTVAPRARVRHRGQLALRRPDLNVAAMRARNEMRATMTLTAGTKLPLRMLEIIGFTLLEIVAGLFTGRFSDAWASVRSVVGAIPRSPTYLARRGSIAKLRRRGAGVGERAISDLHSGGSNRLKSFGRVREMRTLIGVEENIRRWRDRSIAPIVTWLLVVAAVLIASRTFINSRVPVIGEFLELPGGVGDLWSRFTTGWNPNGLGATSPNPSGLAALSIGSILWLFNMGLGMTVLVIGLILAGCLGVWRLSDLFPSNRERLVALVVYAAMPLLPGVISTGRLGPLVAFAAVPWFVHLVRVAVGIGTADPASVNADLVDGLIDLTLRERVRRTAVAGLVVALAAALAPPVIVIVAVVALVLAASTMLVGAGSRTALSMTATGLAAAAIGWLGNLPWSATWSWHELTTAELGAGTGRSLIEIATMNIGEGELGVLGIALYLPVLTALVLAGAWRLTWAARAGGIVVVFGALAVLGDRDVLPVRLPETGYLLAPVALGLALAAAIAVASFSSDVAGGSFGWRQPLGVASIGAVVVALFPSLLTLTDGSWYAPSSTLSTFLDARIQPDADAGDFRVLYLGDPRLLPGASTPVEGSGDNNPISAGIAMTLTGPGDIGIEHVWTAPGTSADGGLQQVLGDVAANFTQRGGRLLAPYAIRYIVVPVYDGAVSTADDPLPLPSGLIESLSSQLDLELLRSPPNYVVFENRSFFPGAALFTGAAATTAVETTDAAALVHADLSSGTAALGTVLDDRSGSGPVEPGVLQVSVPFDDHWKLSVDGTEIPAREGLGGMTAFDVPVAGNAVVTYDGSGSRGLEMVGQGLLWVLVLLAASRLRTPALLSRLVSRTGAVTESGGDGGHIVLDEMEPDDDFEPIDPDRTVTVQRIAVDTVEPDTTFDAVNRDVTFDFDADDGGYSGLAEPARSDDRPDEEAAAWISEMFDDGNTDDTGGQRR